MKVCIIQPPYTTDASKGEAVFEKELELLESCDESIDLIVMPESCDSPCYVTTEDEANKLVEKYRPDIVVFDTLQGFLPDGVDMAKRKDMRDALNPLNKLGAKFGTSFLMIMHTNKSNNSGRQRMADSSDIWDIGRSALMAGRTKDNGICYMSHEKSNYGPLQKTILFRITEEGAEFIGTTNRKDRDYMAEGLSSVAPTPRLDEAREFILDNVPPEGIEVKALEQMAKAAGLAEHTLRDARAALKTEKRISIKSRGFGDEKKWYVYTANENERSVR